MQGSTITHLLVAAESGDAAAQFNLGVLYDSRLDDNGYAIEGNRAEAMKWLLAAAERHIGSLFVIPAKSESLGARRSGCLLLNPRAASNSAPAHIVAGPDAAMTAAIRTRSGQKTGPEIPCHCCRRRSVKSPALPGTRGTICRDLLQASHTRTPIGIEIVRDRSPRSCRGVMLRARIGSITPKRGQTLQSSKIFEGSIAFNLQFSLKFDAHLTGSRRLYDAPWAILLRSRPTVRRGPDIGGWR